MSDRDWLEICARYGIEPSILGENPSQDALDRYMSEANPIITREEWIRDEAINEGITHIEFLRRLIDADMSRHGG